MCGIAGIINWEDRTVDGELSGLLAKMSSVLAHRGPDDTGEWIEKSTGTGFVHRRLSIIDLSPQGRQPFVDSDNKYILVFNGEIYNYLELKEELLGRGISFHTATDTEVLLEAIKYWGRDALKRLDGMFAFAFHDIHRRRTLLARDPFGEKPLYWTSIGSAFAFASELTALLDLPGFDTRVDSDALAGYFFLQYVDSPLALHRGANKLPPGSWMVVEQGCVRSSGRYFNFQPDKEKVQWNADSLADELEEILLRGLRRRLIADVPVGAFLSGGIDSAIVAALIRKRLGRPLHTFTLGFTNTPLSEHEAARATARHLDCDHHECLIAPEKLGRYGLVASTLDEPNADTSCLPVYLLSEFARTKIKVAVSGDGADELFGGYSRYARMLAWADSGHHSAYGEHYYMQHLRVWSEGQFISALYDRPDGFLARRDALFAEIDTSPMPLCDRLRVADVNHYLPGSVLAKVDRMSMRHGLEVRTPFLSPEVANFAARLPREALINGGVGKFLLRHLAKRYLPASWIDREKMGFSLPNDSQWAETLERDVQQGLRVNHGDVHPWLVEEKLLDAADPGNLFQLWSLLILRDYSRIHPSASFLRRDRLGDWMLLRKLARTSHSALVYSKMPDTTWNIFLNDGGIEVSVDKGVPAGGNEENRQIIYADPVFGKTPESDCPIGTWGRTHDSYRRIGESSGKPVRAANNKSSTPLLYDQHTGAVLPFTWRKAIADLQYLSPRIGSPSLNEILQEQTVSLIRRDTPQRAFRLVCELSAMLSSYCRSNTQAKVLRKIVRSDNELKTEATPPKRIVFLIHDLAAAGAERQLFLHAIATRDAGFETSVLVWAPLHGTDAHYLHLFQEAGIPTYSCAYPNRAVEPITMATAFNGVHGDFLEMLPPQRREMIWNLVSHLSILRPDRLYCFVDLSCLIGGISAIFTKTSYVLFSFRNKNPTHFSFAQPWIYPYYRQLIASKRVILTGNSFAGNDDYARWLGIPRESIAVVRNGIDNRKWSRISAPERAAARHHFKIGEDHACIAGVFQLEHYKRPLVFLDVIRRVLNRIKKPLVVLVAGNGQLSSVFRQTIRQLELGGIVRMMGRRNDIPRILAASDLLLLASGHGEGTPNVLLEAQARGLPVVTSNAGGGAREALRDGRSGFVNASGDLDGLVDSCIRILTDEELRNRMGRESVNFINVKYSMRSLRERLAEIYCKPEVFACPHFR